MNPIQHDPIHESNMDRKLDLQSTTNPSFSLEYIVKEEKQSKFQVNFLLKIENINFQKSNSSVIKKRVALHNYFLNMGSHFLTI